VSDFYNRGVDVPVAERLTTQRPQGVFTSSHWSEPNVFAHVRMTDRTDVDGKSLAFIEEIQSDWHQRGRQQGYGEWSDRKIVSDSGEIGIARVQNKNGVPDVPFKKNWQEIAFKRAVADAIREGKDRVGWTTGEQQASRYGREGIEEGMEGFYDKIIPDYARKFAKRYKSQVGKTEIRTVVDDEGWHEIWFMDITPEMKKAFGEEGFKLYSKLEETLMRQTA
jgi:hypothetical protein